MEERSSARTCDRENDLIAFLYGEVDERERRDFERHLRACSECESELSAFKPIQASIVAWRDEALGRVVETASVQAQASTPRKQSAMTAFREFFSLSPLWLKGTVAFASIAFCIFGSLALVGLLNRSNESVASNNQKRYTEDEVNKKIDEAVQAKVQELERAKNEPPIDKASIINDGSRPVQTVLNPSRRSTSPQNAKTLSRPLTKSEREQLAVDLRLISPKDDITLDLIGDRINQEE